MFPFPNLICKPQFRINKSYFLFCCIYMIIFNLECRGTSQSRSTHSYFDPFCFLVLDLKRIVKLTKIQRRMLKKASLLIPGTYISRYVGPKLKTIFALFYFRAFLNIFSNMLMPLFWTYLGRPRNVGQRNKRGCFWHPPIQQLSKTQKIQYNSPFLQVIHSKWLIIKTRLFRRHTGYQICVF